MASTFSPLLRLELQATGENLNTWGQLLNAVIRQAEASIAGVTTIDTSSPGTTTLTTANGMMDQARSSTLKFTGAKTGDVEVIIPDGPKLYVLVNESTGTGALTLKTSSGTALTIAADAALFVAVDGSEIIVLGGQAPGGVIDATTLNGQNAAFYLDYANFTGTAPSGPDYSTNIIPIGGLIFGFIENTQASIELGENFAGTSLHPSGIHTRANRSFPVQSGGQSSSGVSTLTGTYRALGSTDNIPTSTDVPATLFVRIS